MRLKNRDLSKIECRVGDNLTSPIGKYEGVNVWLPFQSFRIGYNVRRGYLAPTSTAFDQNGNSVGRFDETVCTHVIDFILDDTKSYPGKIISWTVKPMTQEDRDNFYKTDYKPPLNTYQN